ncbi:MAG: CBS domain-containing protein [Spirochaetaceae bacterium]|jgi:PTS system nitrogen regulatory IIA component|nr:CBS domain-containing protein [Spirochaetaceae bacterium]
MKLSSLIQPSLIIRSKALSREKLLDELFKALQKQDRNGLPHSEIQEAVAAREKIGSTVLPSGLAIPHARMHEFSKGTDFSDFIIAIAIPEKPISSGDGSISMMVLFLSSAQTMNTYLNALAAFTKYSRDGNFFKQLCAAEPVDFIELIKSRDAEVKKEATVESIMSSDFVQLSPEETLSECVVKFTQNKIGYLPVVQAGKLVGELTILDLFSLGLPEYILKLQTMQYIRGDEPFKKLFEKIDNTKKIKEVMKKPELIVKTDNTIMDVVMMLVKNKRRYLPVVEQNDNGNGAYKGVVSFIDILEKALEV